MQNIIILAIVVFEIAMKKTLNVFFGSRPKLSPIFCQMSLRTKVHHLVAFEIDDHN